MSQSWKLFIISLGFLTIIASVFSFFLGWHEARPGWYFDDPFFKLYKAKDYSILIMSVLYLAIAYFIFTHRNKPLLLTTLAFAYAISLLFRMLTLTLFPFYADADAVKLFDPFLNTFIYPNNYVERDLFFSGHAALCFLMTIISPDKINKLIFISVTIWVSVFIVLQKVHFSIDVAAAPFFAILSLKIANYLLSKKVVSQAE